MPMLHWKSMGIQRLSVFFPVVNEEGNLENTVKKAVKVLENLKLKYEILIIDDGSVDKTGEIAEKLAKENSLIRVKYHEGNYGYGEALKTGFYNSKYEFIVYTDGDGQFEFSEVDKFIEKIVNYDLIIGFRIKRKDNFIRTLFARGWAFALFLFFGLNLKDVDCGFKMVRKKVLDTIPRLASTRGGMINAELAIKAKKFGFKITQIGVAHYPRVTGKPTGANINVIASSFADLFKLWWKLRKHEVD